MRVYSARKFFYLRESLDIRAIEKNAEVWRPRAVAEYLRLVGFIEGLRFKPTEERQKHHPFRALSRDQIIAKSTDKESFFFSTVEVANLENLMWCVMVQKWKDIAEKRPRHVYLESEGELGASDKKATNLVRFDFSYAPAEVHGHPKTAYDSGCGLSLVYDENYEAGYYDEDTYDEFYFTVDDDVDPASI